MSQAAGEVKVLLVEDHPGVREVLRDVIAATPGFVLVGEAGCGEEAIDAIGSLRPGLVLMDVRMPGIGGIAAARDIVQRNPAVKVLLTSTCDAAVRGHVERLNGAAAFRRKQDLRPGVLREVWEGFHAPNGV